MREEADRADGPATQLQTWFQALEAAVGMESHAFNVSIST